MTLTVRDPAADGPLSMRTSGIYEKSLRRVAILAYEDDNLFSPA